MFDVLPFGIGAWIFVGLYLCSLLVIGWIGYNARRAEFADLHLSRGEKREVTYAIRDFKRALEVAPKDWTMRPITEEKLREAQSLRQNGSGELEN